MTSSDTPSEALPDTNAGAQPAAAPITAAAPPAGPETNELDAASGAASSEGHTEAGAGAAGDSLARGEQRQSRSRRGGRNRGRGGRANRDASASQATDGAPAASAPRRAGDRSARPARNERPTREVHPLLEKLAALYPQLFGARFLPLQRGIYEALLARHPEELPEAELKVALGLHARSGRYLDAIAQRLPRHNLEGEVVEPVAPEHVHHAIVELHRRRQNRTQEDLRPKLVARLADAIEASGLDRVSYTEQVRVSKADGIALIDEAFAELGRVTARREALQRAFEASGQTDVDAFADMYGIPTGEARRFLKPRHAASATPANESAAATQDAESTPAPDQAA